MSKRIEPPPPVVPVGMVKAIDDAIAAWMGFHGHPRSPSLATHVGLSLADQFVISKRKTPRGAAA